MVSKWLDVGDNSTSISLQHHNVGVVIGAIVIIKPLKENLKFSLKVLIRLGMRFNLMWLIK